jgi:hypothetical protein
MQESLNWRTVLKISNNNRIVSILDDDLDITWPFHDAICGNIDGISVVTFHDPVLALEYFRDNKKDFALIISDLRMKSEWFRATKENKELKS